MAYADSAQVTDPDNNPSHDGSTIVAVVPVCIPVGEIPALLAAYDPNNTNHPLAVTAKPLAKLILDALIAAGYGDS
tara:strand:+ start:200 stop:427 length:228 start_codon:yes stop_codon:yes gene_type:complete